MRNTVPLGGGICTLGPAVGSGSSRFTMTGVAFVFQSSVEIWPGRCGFRRTFGAKPVFEHDRFAVGVMAGHDTSDFSLHAALQKNLTLLPATQLRCSAGH